MSQLGAPINRKATQSTYVSRDELNTKVDGALSKWIAMSNESANLQHRRIKSLWSWLTVSLVLNAAGIGLACAALTQANQ